MNLLLSACTKASGLAHTHLPALTRAATVLTRATAFSSARLARAWPALLLAALALVPILHVVIRGWFASRNVPYWDEIDTAIALLLRLEPATLSDVLHELTALNNEHRMATSRLLFMVSYWTTGSIDFTVIGLLGSATICVAAVLLVANAGDRSRRLALGLLLAALLFHLGHYENFYWSGASIDHLQIVLLAVVAVLGLAGGSRAALLAAGVAALLATFTLAHGLLLWPTGIVLLAAARRRRHLALWTILAAATAGVFLAGFGFNGSHAIGDFSPAGLGRIAVYWLTLCGAPLALGQTAVAPVLGLGLLALWTRHLWRGALRREPVAVGLALWTIAALALIAVGRVDVARGEVYSRYLVLGGLAWALGFFLEWQARTAAGTPLRRWWPAVALLAVFQVAANIQSAPAARTWVAQRDLAVDAFLRHGRDGAAPVSLHPLPAHATRVLEAAEKAGVFLMPQAAIAQPAVAAAPAGKGFRYSVDRIQVDSRMIVVEGWAAQAGIAAVPGQVQLVLESARGRLFLASESAARPDVAAAYPRQAWRDSGFRFASRRWLVPPDDYRIGLLHRSAKGAEILMTNKRLDLSWKAPTGRPDFRHPNGNRYDLIIPQTADVAVTPEPGKIARISLLDPAGNLVHIDFAGAGTLTLHLADAVGPALPLLYGNRQITYMQGRAALRITGADETSGLTISSVRRSKVAGPESAEDAATAGIAQLASLEISSRNGRFGAVRAGNVHFSAHAGLAGIRAPGVQFAGPVVVGDIRAHGDALPVLQLGAVREVRIAGGSLAQPNGQPLHVGLALRLRFVHGGTSHGVLLPAQTNLARLRFEGNDDHGVAQIRHPDAPERRALQ